jgi:fermentation-respiration switch protein FrsA (DUF1100 family)
MYDMSRVIHGGWQDSLSEEERGQALVQLGEQRYKDFINGEAELGSTFPCEPVDEIPQGLDPIAGEFFEFYGMKRGHHPNSVGAFTLTSAMSFINFPLLSYIKSISPRPTLFVMGEHAHSRYFSEGAYSAAAEPKELYIVRNAGHVDLYDRTDLIPFDKLESFFVSGLK